MANVLVDETALQDIADAIRTKNGTQNTYKPGQMAEAIEAIPSGGITPTGTININTNGTTDVTQYASANVAVPNSYAAADEGKVVSNGALVAQTSKNIGANGTVDTTLNNQVVVAVPNSYSASDEGKVVSNGALVAQGSDTVTQNGTVDTTLIKNLTVNVPSTTPTGTKQISITQNGTTTEDVTNYANAEITVNVPTGGGATFISSEAVSGQQGKQINVSSSWFDTYDLVIIIPNITLSAQDWLYAVKDATTGGMYTNKHTSFGEPYKTVLSKSASTAINYMFNTDHSPYVSSGAVNTYLYYYAYTSGVTMTGTFDIYGINL